MNVYDLAEAAHQINRTLLVVIPYLAMQADKQGHTMTAKELWGMHTDALGRHGWLSEALSQVEASEMVDPFDAA